MKIIRFIVLLGCLVNMLISCNLSDFDLSKFSEAVGPNPVIYRPFARGSYMVKDFSTGVGVGSVAFKNDSLNFNPISYSLDSMVFNTTGTDSMVVIIKTVNETPMKYRYWLSLNGTILDSRVKSKYLPAAIINSQGDVIESTKDSLEFALDSVALNHLKKASHLDLAITLYQPDKGTVLANVLKSSQISFFIGFRAPINLFKIKI